MTIAPILAQASPPAAGAPLLQVLIAGTFLGGATAALLGVAHAHRTGRTQVLSRAAAMAEGISGGPGWVALPTAVAAASLLSALFGVTWDISLHIDNGRDAGPLANPSHYFIMLGLFGIFAAGVLAITLPGRESAGPAAIRLSRTWQAPVGGVLLLLSASFGLLGFPLDDVWHRLFGQDVTLWGPTHVMMIAGAVMTLVGLAVLGVEGLRARRPGRDRRLPVLARVARVSLPGALLLGFTVFQGEFDWGVPQYREVWHPLLLALSSGMALTLARLWAGRGGALGATAFYLVVNAAVIAVVGDVLGESKPAMPLYIAEALLVEAVALRRAAERRPLRFGALGGLLCGTAGFAAEYAWSHAVMPLPWTTALLPEGAVLAALAGTAAGLLGVMLAGGLRGELPPRPVARAVCAGALATLAALGAIALVHHEPRGVRAEVTLQEVRPAPEREAIATVRIEPPGAARDAQWLYAIAWQGGGLIVDRLRPVGDGVWRSTRPLPLHGDWKTMIRLHRGHALLAAPLYLPQDPALSLPGMTLPPHSTRPLVWEQHILQRERKQGISASLWNGAVAAVLALCALFLAGLSWGVARVGRARGPAPPAGGARLRAPMAKTPTPIGA